MDIDLNYIAQLEREAMLAERSEIVKAVEQVSAGLGYKVQNGIDDHALREWHLRLCQSCRRAGTHSGEINFLMRAALRVSRPRRRGSLWRKDQSHDRPFLDRRSPFEEGAWAKS